MAERPNAAVAPLGLFGETSEARRKIVFNRFENLLSKSYRLLSQSQYKKAKEMVFDSVDSEQCTEKYCIRKIQELLQVERLFFLEIAVHEELTQLKVTLVRDEDTLVQEDICRECAVEKLYGKIGVLVDKIITEDLGKTAGPEQDGLTKKDDSTAPEMEIQSESDWIWHLTAVTVLMGTAWKAMDEADRFNDLEEHNQELMQQSQTVASLAEYSSLKEESDRNREKMQQHKTNVLLLDTLAALAVAWEAYLIYTSAYDEQENNLAVRPVYKSRYIGATLTFTWNW
ncbi:MAG: hypothetical protein GY866_18630 [Proteobacteria bacterium]|nr:hypothetical protein [Pseudomonadota bacterium]